MKKHLISFLILFSLLGFLFTSKANAACSDPGLVYISKAEGSSSVTYTLKVTNNCTTKATFYLSSPDIPSGWSYLYGSTGTTCSTNTRCSITLSAGSSDNVTLKITRPKGQTPGDYIVYARAYLTTNSDISRKIQLPKYIVCTNCDDKNYECGSFTNSCGVKVTCPTCTKATCNTTTRQCIAWKYYCNKTTFTCTQTSSGTLTKTTCDTTCAPPPTNAPTATPVPPRPTATPVPNPTTYACINYVCTAVDDGSGYSSTSECNSKCVAPPSNDCPSRLSDLAPAGIPVGGLCMVNRIIQLGINILLIVSIILAILFLIWGGATWILSEGDKQKLSQAKQRITLAVIGLTIIFSSFAVLKIIQFLFRIG